jgi:hypothetical protein
MIALAPRTTALVLIDVQRSLGVKDSEALAFATA